MSLDALLAFTENVAREAGAILAAGYRTGAQVHKKGRIDLVTEFDLRSERLIRERIGTAYPAHAIVGEEGGRTAGSSDWVWYVDPLDGTTNFAHGHPFFCVSMGLYEGTTPQVAVVHAPILGITWSARAGGGTQRNGEPCAVSKTVALIDALVATGFPYNRRSDADDNIPETRAFLRRTHGMRRCGSAAIDLAMVADGSFDLYWEQQLNAWDLAAGALLVLEAGGTVTDYDGTPADPLSGRLLASKGPLHPEALEVLREARLGL